MNRKILSAQEIERRQVEILKWLVTHSRRRLRRKDVNFVYEWLRAMPVGLHEATQ